MYINGQEFAGNGGSIMSDILLVKCNVFVSQKQLQNILDYIKSQKETGVIVLPPYLDAQLVPNDIEIKLVDENGKKGETKNVTCKEM